MKRLGLDIGGANLKAATSDGCAIETPFALWQFPDELPEQTGKLIQQAPAHEGYAVTMTGELADCYASKAEGVASIVQAVEQATTGSPTAYYTFDGRFVSTENAIADWKRVAAANWHALASAVALQAPDAVLIDIGSTTTDIVVIRRGKVVDHGETDTQRLTSGSLLYQGVGRTPVCAVVDSLPYRGRTCSTAAELFATTADAALVLGHAQPTTETDTADGRSFSEQNAIARLGRMVCADETEFNRDDALTAAEYIEQILTQRLAENLRRLKALEDDRQVVISGAGAWLARKTLSSLDRSSPIVELSQLIGNDASRCAPAWAVATLAELADA